MRGPWTRPAGSRQLQYSLSLTTSPTQRGSFGDALQPAWPHRPVRFRTLPRHDDLRRRRRHLGARSATCSRRDAERLVGRALDAGINFIDTADVYADGLSEQITGQALKNLKVPRDNVVRRDQGVRRDRPERERARRFALSHHRRREGESEAPATRSRRPVPDPRLRSGHADRGDACARSTRSCSTATCAMSACRTGRRGRS